LTGSEISEGIWSAEGKSVPLKTLPFPEILIYDYIPILIFLFRNYFFSSREGEVEKKEDIKY